MPHTISLVGILQIGLLLIATFADWDIGRYRHFTKNTVIYKFKLPSKTDQIFFFFFFFFWKGWFSQKRLRLRFWNLHQWIPCKKKTCIRFSCHQKTKFLFPKHEFGYGVAYVDRDICRLEHFFHNLLGHLTVRSTNLLQNIQFPPLTGFKI